MNLAEAYGRLAEQAERALGADLAHPLHGLWTKAEAVADDRVYQFVALRTYGDWEVATVPARCNGLWPLWVISAHGGRSLTVHRDNEFNWIIECDPGWDDCTTGLQVTPLQRTVDA